MAYSSGITATVLAVCCWGMVATTAHAERMQIQRNIPYSQKQVPQTAATTLDIYAPPGEGKRPVVVWIHGGGWRFGDKNLVDHKPQFLTSQGYVLVSINYRLHPEADFRAQGADVAESIAWVSENIEKYSGDPDKIVVMGHSAGAHLAALIGTDERYLQAVDLDLDVLKGIILVDGACYDVCGQIRQTQNLVRAFFVLIFTQDLAFQQAASPVNYVTAEKKIPPMQIQYIRQRPDARLQSHNFAEVLKKAGVSVEIHEAPQESHNSINRDLGLPQKPMTQWVVDFLQQVAPVPEQSP